MSNNTTLRTEGLSKQWGAFKANSDVSLSFAPGARHALIGPNGAGKTTFINLLTGTFAPTSGKVFFGDEDITALAQHQRVKRGMTRTFQINTLFAGLTVLESVVLAISERRGMQYVWRKTVASQQEVIDEAMALLGSLKLEAEANSITRSLAYGKQRLVEIALALATRPKVLLLDEPAAGIPSAESKELFEVIAQLPRDVTIVLSSMTWAWYFVRRTHYGAGWRQGIDRGTPAEIAADPRVKEVYLGEAEHA